jgi:hypothetical protein
MSILYVFVGVWLRCNWPVAISPLQYGSVATRKKAEKILLTALFGKLEICK